MDRLLDAQIAYYDARAMEYDTSLHYHAGHFTNANPDVEALHWIQRTVRSLPRVASTLELGCGTGIWTRELLRTTRRLHAVDSSERMIELNRAANPTRTSYECVDLFRWIPQRRFDRVAAAFLFSHVPDHLTDAFFEIVGLSRAAAGTILLIDEAIPFQQCSPGSEAVRELADGKRYSIVKVYRSIRQVRTICQRHGYVPAFELSAGRLFAVLLSR